MLREAKRIQVVRIVQYVQYIHFKYDMKSFSVTNSELRIEFYNYLS